MSSLAQYQLPIGIEVEVPNNRKGILKFVGKVDTKPGLFAGIQLTDGSPGRNNGDFKSVSYFTVDLPLSGIFYSYESIARLNESKLPKKPISQMNGRYSSQSKINRRTASSSSISNTPISGRASPLSRSYSNSRGSRSISSSYMSQSISSTPSAARYGTSTITEESESAETSYSNPLSRPSSSISNGSRPSSRADTKPLNNSGIRQVTSNASLRASNNNSRNSYSRSLDILSPPSPVSPQSTLYDSHNDSLGQAKSLNAKYETLLRENSNLSSELIHYKTELENTINMLDEYKQKINEDLCPVIEEYQILLDQKESRITKLKQSSEEQKNDLRNAITILEEQTIENEKLYQHEINNLKQKLANPNQSLSNDSAEKDEKIKSLSDQIAQLQIDVSTSQSKFIDSSLAENNAIIVEFKEENTQLKQELSNLRKEYEDLQGTLEECIDDKKSKINSLRKNFTLELEEKSKQIIMMNNVMNDTFNDSSTNIEDSDSDDNNERINELEDLNRLAESKLFENQKTLESQAAQIFELSSNLEESRKLVDSQAQQIDTLTSRLNECESLINHKDGKIKILERTNLEAQNVSDSPSENITSEDNACLKKQLKEKESVILERNLEIYNLKTQLAEKSENDFKEKSKELNNYSKDLNKKIDELEYSISVYQDKNEILVKENHNLLSKLKELTLADSVKSNKEIEDLKQKNSELESSVRNLQSQNDEVSQTSNKILKLSNDNSELVAKSKLFDEQFNNLTNSKKQLEDINETLEAENKVLKSQIESLRKSSISNEITTSYIEGEQESDQKEKSLLSDKTHIEPIASASANIDEVGSLPIYKPSTSIDPSRGRNKWCGLCEREGHDSYECPFETDL